MNDFDLSGDLGDLSAHPDGGLPWLWPSVDLGARGDAASEAATKAVSCAATVIDGRAWLAAAGFKTIMYGIEFGKVRGRPVARVEYGQLLYRTKVDPAALPTNAPELSWWFFKETLHTLEEIAQLYQLGAPPLAPSGSGRDDGIISSQAVGDAQEFGAAPLPPVAFYAPSDVEPDLAALTESEVLLVLRYKQDGETEPEAARRRLREESALVEKLGPVRASSTSGNAYTITFARPAN